MPSPVVGTIDRYHADPAKPRVRDRRRVRAFGGRAVVYPRGKVQLEEKLVDGLDTAHAELQQREDLMARDLEELPAPVVEAVEDASLKLRGQLLGAVRMILDRQTLELSSLHLPQLEMDGLVALQVAVEGKSEMSQIVYASDRRDLLERALGVLQPDFSRSDDGAARELRAQLEDLVHRVGELREHLVDLEDAQDELEGKQKTAMEAGAADPGDKPKPSDPDAPRPATTLTGPERPEPARPATTLTGPERPDPRPAATTLTGPERPDPRPAATTLTGPERPEPSRPATTLTGPELPAEEPPASTLGEPETDDGGANAKRPWWRRPFG
jgi:hypothetical protein